MSRRYLPLFLVLITAFIPACSSVGPKGCYHNTEEIKVTAKIPTPQLHQSLKHDVDHFFKTGSTKDLDNYNRQAAALLHKSYCKNHNLRHLSPDIGSWTTVLPKGAVAPETFDEIYPATFVDISPVLHERYQGSGLGVPLIGWIDNHELKPKPPTFMAPRGRAISLTAVLNYKNNQPTWILYPSKVTRSISAGGTSFDLAADYTAANAIFWSRSTLRKNILTGLILPDRITTGTGLYLDEPYDPTKIPILCVHGLKSSPDAFRYMVNQLRSVKEVRKNYQFVYFYYPTGAPWIYSARKFRADVRRMQAYAATRGGSKTFNNMVVLAHSMGGLVSRTSISANPQELYKAVYNTPLQNLSGSRKNKELIRQTLHFQPLTAPKRIIFMATPHKGSTLADWKTVNLLSQLIKLPANVSLDLLTVLNQNSQQLLKGNPRGLRLPTSLSELSPNDPFIKAVPKLKFPSSIKVHSIIGAYKGDKSTDGVVPYWSSHLPDSQTQSELIINSWHNVPYHPEAIQETTRILKLHLKQN